MGLPTKSKFSVESQLDPSRRKILGVVALSSLLKACIRPIQFPVKCADPGQ
jgi:hypothetical protein